MKKLLVYLFTAFMTLGFTASANATILTFDDITTDGGANMGTYSGLIWNNMSVLKGAEEPGSGYATGIISPSYVTYNNSGSDANVSGIDGKLFTLNNAYFTSAWRNDNSLTVTGYRGAGVIGSKTVTLNMSQPLLVSFNFENVDRLLFHSTNSQFVMDNMRINESSTPAPAPEPSSMVLGLLSLSGLFGLRKKNNQATIA